MSGVIGQSLPRQDGVEKAKGSFQYVSDHFPTDCLTGKLLRSVIPHGRVKSLNLERAKRLSGVHAVIGIGDSPGRRYNPIYNQSNPTTDLLVKDEMVFEEEIRYLGQPVAAVAAVSADLAEEALTLIEVEYEELPAVFDMEKALEPGAPIVRPGGEGNIAFGWRDADEPITLHRGTLEEGFMKADSIFEDEFTTQRINQTALEPHLAIAWPESGGRLAMLSTTQSIFGLRSCLAEALGISPGRIRILRPNLGGAFGKGLDLAVNEVVCAIFCSSLISSFAC